MSPRVCLLCNKPLNDSFRGEIRFKLILNGSIAVDINVDLCWPCSQDVLAGRSQLPPFTQLGAVAASPSFISRQRGINGGEVTTTQGLDRDTWTRQ